MKISFIPKNYEESLSCDGLSAIPKKHLEKLISELKSEDPNLVVKEANYGVGADWIWVLLIMSGFFALIERGEKLSKGINGWINIGKKIKKFKKKARFIKLDRDAQLALSLLKILKLEGEISSLKLISESEIDIKNNSQLFINKPVTEFTSKEESYSIFVLEINEAKYYILGCNIDGSVELLKTIDLKKFG